MGSMILLNACFSFFCLLASHGLNNDATFMNLDQLPKMKKSSVLCENGEVESPKVLGIIEMVVIERRPPQNTKNIEFIEKKNSKAPLSRTGHFAACMCNMEYRLMDLGVMYYPRYLPTGICRETICWGSHRCRQKNYKVRVLKKRTISDIEGNSLLINALPDSLKEDWIGETVTTIVACECRP